MDIVIIVVEIGERPVAEHLNGFDTTVFDFVQIFNDHIRDVYTKPFL